MNLACVTHAYPRWDGDVAGAFVERLVLALVHRGHAVHVIAPADEGRGGKEVRHQVPVTRVRYAPARWETLAYRGRMVAAARTPWGLSAATSLVVRQARAIAGICSDGHIDLVHAHWWAPGGISAWLARRPYVVTLHGTDVALLERFAAARWVARRVLPGAALVTAVSTYLANRAASVAGLEARRIAVQPMPVDVRAFARTSAGGGGVVTVGRLSKQKRVDLVVEAVALLKQRGRALPLTIVGDGPERPYLERRAAELGIAGETRFLGEVPPDRIPQAVGDAHADPVDGRRRRDEQGLPAVLAPVHVPDRLRHLDHAEMLAVGREDPDTVRAGDVDVAALVELHPVDETALREITVADVLGEHAAVRERMARADVEDADVRARGVVDVEQ